MFTPPRQNGKFSIFCLQFCFYYASISLPNSWIHERHPSLDENKAVSVVIGRHAVRKQDQICEITLKRDAARRLLDAYDARIVENASNTLRRNDGTGNAREGRRFGSDLTRD